MNLILDRCPFYEQATEVETTTGPVHVRAYQIVVSGRHFSPRGIITSIPSNSGYRSQP